MSKGLFVKNLYIKKKLPKSFPQGDCQNLTFPQVKGVFPQGKHYHFPLAPPPPKEPPPPEKPPNPPLEKPPPENPPK